MDVRTVRVALGGLLVVALVVFGATKLLGDDDDDGGGGAASAAPIGLSESELVGRAGDLDHLTYWLGPVPNIDEYELTEIPDGRIYIRYLTEDADPGDTRASFLTVGTYEIPDAMDALRQAESAGGTKGISKEDGFSLLEAGNRLSVYVVFDDEPDLQVEIYDPTPGSALEFARSGSLRPLS